MRRAGTRRQGDRKTRRYVLVLFALLVASIVGCGESPFEPDDSAPSEISGSLTALDFPTADGSVWEYVSLENDYSYTTVIDGTKNIAGRAVRMKTSDSESPVSQMGVLFGLPIRNSFFTKDIYSYTEHAFDLWSGIDTFQQRNLPKRLLWSFPMNVGKEWIVSDSYAEPAITYSRKVVSDKNTVTVPAGAYENVYYIEEYSVYAGLLPEEQLPPSKYWVAPDVGIIKYEFFDPFSGTTIVYELNSFERGR